MEDVAARAGVSRALVSIVFRELPGASPANRERVRRAAAEIGFRPDRRASLLGSKRTNLLGVVFGVGHEFHADLISALYAAAARHGLELVLSGVTEERSEQLAVAELVDFRCDALVLLGPSLSAAELTAYASSTPVVVLARAVRAPGVEVIRTDDELGARLATEHLLALGHRTVVHLDGRRAPGAAERRRGFLAAMRTAGADGGAHRWPAGLTEADGENAARRYLAERSAGDAPAPDAPTAVFAFNDRCAAGFLHTVRAAGVEVPADLSVVGYDDSRLAHASWTRLTTVGQDTEALCAGAVARVLGRVRPAADPAPGAAEHDLLVSPSLVVRATSGPPGGVSHVPLPRGL
jgi:DNA-binding LacI/PurR family transcriptional regulator